MKVEMTGRGFERIEFQDCLPQQCSLQQSSVVGDIGRKAGTTAIWLGTSQDRMHLDRGQVADLVGHLQAWMATGSFKVEVPR